MLAIFIPSGATLHKWISGVPTKRTGMYKQYFMSAPAHAAPTASANEKPNNAHGHKK